MNLLAERVRGRVTFRYFRDNCLWYATDDGWEFPVDISETENGQGASPTFLASDKAIYFMRWIRKSMEVKDKA